MLILFIKLSSLEEERDEARPLACLGRFYSSGGDLGTHLATAFFSLLSTVTAVWAQ